MTEQSLLAIYYFYKYTNLDKFKVKQAYAARVAAKAFKQMKKK